jgi:hypothetical protein
MPRLDTWKGVEYLIEWTAKQNSQILVPGEEGQVRQGALVAYEPSPPFVDSIEDTEDAEGSVFIAGYCGRVIFGVKNGKTYRRSWVSGRPLPQSGGVPCELSVVWALLAHLKVEPLVQEMLLVKPVVG